MKLRVSTNFDNALIPGLAGTDTEELYGKLPHDVVGGVRPAFLLPQVGREEIEEHIRQAHMAEELVKTRVF